MIGHHARFRENDDLPLGRGPAAKKKPPFFNARALITRKIMRRGMRNAILGNNLKVSNSEFAALNFIGVFKTISYNNEGLRLKCPFYTTYLTL